MTVLSMYTAQKMKFPLKVSSVNATKFPSRIRTEYEEILRMSPYSVRMWMRIWSHLLKKLLMENFILCAVVIEWSLGYNSD